MRREIKFWLERERPFITVIDTIEDLKRVKQYFISNRSSIIGMQVYIKGISASKVLTGDDILDRLDKMYIRFNEELLEVENILKSLDIEYDIDIYDNYFLLNIYSDGRVYSIVTLKFIYPNNSEEVEEIVRITLEKALCKSYGFRCDIAYRIIELLKEAK